MDFYLILSLTVFEKSFMIPLSGARRCALSLSDLGLWHFLEIFHWIVYN